MATPIPSFTTSSSAAHLTPQTTTSTNSPLGTAAITPSSSSSGTRGGNTFEFPREYHFPPFFTRQTNLTTYHSQLEKWSSFILAYCRHHRIFRLSLSSPTTEDLFCNRRLNRRLNTKDAREVMEFMRKEGRVEFLSPGSAGERDGGAGKDVAWIYWRTPEEWAGLVEAWVDETAQKGMVLTLYELTEGEGTRGTEIHGLDTDILQRALQVLVKRGKAQVFGQADQLGVKFF